MLADDEFEFVFPQDIDGAPQKTLGVLRIRISTAVSTRSSKRLTQISNAVLSDVKGA
jgi:hypothetical protein